MSETFERITSDQIDEQPGHIYRYELAAGWLESGWSVVDVACGVGYGAEVIARTKKVSYLGVDKIEPEKRYSGFGEFVSGVDLNTFELQVETDAAICFETLEHLENPQHLANQLIFCADLIIVSVPTQPTKHMNPYHLHDFTVEDIIKMFTGCELVHLEEQPEELSHIFVFKVSGD
jgi:2-polyprenyl-3-methyl-5-hydroxy-6-metoxy-1,4-benzoquinol methylase